MSTASTALSGTGGGTPPPVTELRTGLAVTVANVFGPCGSAAAGDDILRLSLECDVTFSFATSGGYQPPPTLWGMVQIRNIHDGQWYYVPVADETSDLPLYGFYAPVEESTTATLKSYKWYTRREFMICSDQLSDWVDSNNQCKLRFIHTGSYSGGGSFPSSSTMKSRYDLVQVTRMDRPAPDTMQINCIFVNQGASLAIAQGPDSNFSGTAELDDFDEYVTENMEGSDAGDYNGDGVVDSADLDDYVVDFVNQQ